MKFPLILCIVALVMMVPSAFAASGEISLEKNEFTLYGDGSMVNLTVSGEIFDYLHYPELEIVNNNEVIQIVELFPVKNSLYTVIGLDKNWVE